MTSPVTLPAWFTTRWAFVSSWKKFRPARWDPAWIDCWEMPHIMTTLGECHRNLWKLKNVLQRAGLLKRPLLNHQPGFEGRPSVRASRDCAGRLSARGPVWVPAEESAANPNLIYQQQAEGET